MKAMLFRVGFATLVLGASLGHCVPARANTVIDFDGLSEGTLVTTQFQALGVTFDGPAVLIAGSALNELEFPPFSASNVVGNISTGAQIQANSTGAHWSSASGRITGATAVTLTAFGDDLLPLGSVSTSGANSSSNLNGLFPNILLQTSAPNIAFVQFSAPQGDFTLDDFAFTIVPEPSSVVLAAFAFLGLAAWCCGRMRAGLTGH